MKEINTLDEIEKKQVLNIHSSAIHIQNKVDLLSRQAWFYLVYRAIPLLEDSTTFSIPLSDLKKAIGYNSKNNKYLKQALKQLVETAIEWNIFNKDEESWSIGSLLADCEIKKNSGICEYSFSPKVQKRFINPKMYLKLNLLISKQFNSKHSLALYCLALDFLNLKINYGEKNLSIQDLRTYLGLEKSEYLRVVDIHRRILKKAESDINSQSDMKITITPIQSFGKKIIGFKLHMSIKEDHLDFYKPKKLSEQISENQQSSLFELEPYRLEAPKNEAKKKPKVEKSELIKVKNTELKKFYAEHKISVTTDMVQKKLREVQEIFHEQHEDYLVFLMNYAKQEADKKAIASLSGFYIGLLKDDSQLENYIFHVQKQKENEQNKRHKLRHLVENELETRYEKFISGEFEKYLERNIDKVEEKMVKLIETSLKKGDFLYDAVIMRFNNGKIDKTLITDSKSSVKASIIGFLNSYKDKLGYRAIPYDEWKRELSFEYLVEVETEVEKGFI